MSTRHTVISLLYPHVGVHDVQRVALHRAGGRPRCWVLLLRMAKEHRGGCHGALSVINGETKRQKQEAALHYRRELNENILLKNSVKIRL